MVTSSSCPSCHIPLSWLSCLYRPNVLRTRLGVRTIVHTILSVTLHMVDINRQECSLSVILGEMLSFAVQKHNKPTYSPTRSYNDKFRSKHKGNLMTRQYTDRYRTQVYTQGDNAGRLHTDQRKTMWWLSRKTRVCPRNTRRSPSLRQRT